MTKLSHNFAWMAAANIASSLFNSLIIIYLARVLGPDAFGSFSLAFTAVFLAANFIDLGLSTYGMRSIAKDPARAAVLVSEIVTLRLMIGAALFIVFVFVSLLLPLPAPGKILLAGSALMFFGLASATEWAFQGLEKMRYVFVSLATTSALQLALMSAVVRSAADTWRVPIVYFVAMLPIAVLYLRRLSFAVMVRPADLARMAAHIAGSLTIWAISLTAQFYHSVDIFLLGASGRMGEVGCFTVARRFIDGAALLVIFLANAVFPRLSATFGRDGAQFAATTRSFARLTSVAGIAALVPVFVFSESVLVLTVGSAYATAAVPLRIMIAGLVMLLFNVPYSTGLIAGGFERDVLRQVIASAIVSIVANLSLIPSFGMAGAAFAFVLAESVALAWILAAYHVRIGRHVTKTVP